MFRPGLTLTVNNAKSVLEAGLGAIRSSETQFDLADVAVVDSAAVATLLAWQRAARQLGKTLNFSNIPANLHSLAELYGVDSLLHSSSPVSPRADLPHH
ncbi:MAG: phospholipid transport system transporter-binding protein [Burkholderiales bacterium]